MTTRPPSFALLPCGSPSRNWTDSARHRLLLSRFLVRCARLRPSLKAPVRFAHAWSKSSSPGGRPPTGRPCIAAPSNARPNSKPRSTAFRRCSAFASSNFSVESPRRPPRPNQRPRSPPPPRRHRIGPEVSNAASRVRSGAMILSSQPSSRTRNFLPSSAVVPGVASPSQTSRAPRIRSFSKSRSGPIAGSSAAAVIGRPARVPPIPASSLLHRRPGCSPRAFWGSRSG